MNTLGSGACVQMLVVDVVFDDILWFWDLGALYLRFEWMSWRGF